VAILNKGRLVREGAVSELTAVGERLRLSAGPVDRMLAVLGARGTRDGEAVLADIPRAEGPALIRALVEAGIEISEARWVGTDLEAIFFTETGAIQAPETIHAG
jgi:ABC-2 type transport system ATP-binding protein